MGSSSVHDSGGKSALAVATFPRAVKPTLCATTSTDQILIDPKPNTSKALGYAPTLNGNVEILCDLTCMILKPSLR